jgi:hypothetical protein
MRNRVQTLSTHKGNDGGVVRKLSATRVDIPNLADNCLIEQKTIPRTGHSLSSYGLLAIFVRVIHHLRTGYFPFPFRFFSASFPGFGTGDTEGSRSCIGALSSYLFLRLYI